MPAISRIDGLKYFNRFHRAEIHYHAAITHFKPHRGQICCNRLAMSGGHQHWYWIKSGWIFRVAGAGYAGLIVANSLIDSDLSISDSKTQLGVAAVVFLAGVALKKAYKLTLRVGKKYHFEIFQPGQ